MVPVATLPPACHCESNDSACFIAEVEAMGLDSKGYFDIDAVCCRFPHCTFIKEAAYSAVLLLC
jgi:hypothetical protein